MYSSRGCGCTNGIDVLITSFLSDITYDPLETWLLPKSDMLCMIRCQEDPPGDAHEDGQAAKFMDEENQRKDSSATPRTRTSGPTARTSDRCPEIRRPSQNMPEAKPLQPGNPASPNHRLQKFSTLAWTSGPSPGHPAPREAPDIRPPARTSGACLRAETGQRPMYPLLTYPFVA